jgi:hypothetical protein
MIKINLKLFYILYYVVLFMSFIACIFNFINRHKCNNKLEKDKDGKLVKYGNIIGYNVFLIILILTHIMLMIYYYKSTDDKIILIITIGILFFLLITFVISVTYFRTCNITTPISNIDPIYIRNGTLTFNIISLIIIILSPIINFTLLST